MDEFPGNSLLIARGKEGDELVLSPEQRSKHLYVAGETGSGKSKFLEYLIRQDIENWRDSECGLLLLDWHGPIYKGVMRWLASESHLFQVPRPIIPIDLSRDDWIVAYNLLRQREDGTPAVIVRNFVDAIAYIWGQKDTHGTPRLATHLRSILRGLYDKHLPLSEMLSVLQFENRELRAAIAETVGDNTARDDMLRLNLIQKPEEFLNHTESTFSRILPFLSNPYIRTIYGHPDVSFDFRSGLDEGAIVLVNLSREGGAVAEEDAKIFATLMLTDLWMAANERGKHDDIKPKPFYVYVDEFQEFVTPTIAKNLDQARGFGIHMILANQFPSQLLDASAEYGRRLYNSVMGNTRNKVIFSVSTRENNLEPLADWLYTGTFDTNKVKQEIYSTKVVGYEEEMRRSTTGATTRSRGRTSADGSVERATSVTYSYDEADSDERRKQKTESERYAAGGGSETEAESEMGGYTETPVLIPIMGKELSSREYKSIDEQRFDAQQQIMMQPKRHATLRFDDMVAPREIRTTDVDPGSATQEAVEEYRSEQLAKWPFALPLADARARIEEREQLLLQPPVENEPVETYPKRRVKKKVAAKDE